MKNRQNAASEKQHVTLEGFIDFAPFQALIPP
jgi:hypothetical protein